MVNDNPEMELKFQVRSQKDYDEDAVTLDAYLYILLYQYTWVDVCSVSV